MGISSTGIYDGSTAQLFPIGPRLGRNAKPRM